MTDIRAITLWQPWAGSIAVLGKDIENRSWRTDYRGPVLIHAGATWDPELPLEDGFFDCPICLNCGFDCHLCNGVGLANGNRPAFSRRSVVAIATVSDCVRNSPSPWAAKGQWHFVLDDVRAVSPVVLWTKGERGLWTPPTELVRACGIGQ